MLQRDLARQVRSEPARRLDKTEVETAWQRAKLEMETDDFLDVLADSTTTTGKDDEYGYLLIGFI